MARYVALLGSINVGGNRLTMVDLRDALEREGFEKVETVVASGNVLFDHDERPSDGLAEKIGHIVADRFDIASTVVVLTRDELAEILAESPFADGDEKKVHVHFLAGAPAADNLSALVAEQGRRGKERLFGGRRALHIDFVDGVGTSYLSSAFLERRLNRPGTARNRRSIERILKKMDTA